MTRVPRSSIGTNLTRIGTNLTRRQFVQVGSAGVIVTACGGDAAPPRDTLDADVAEIDTSPPDTAPPDVPEVEVEAELVEDTNTPEAEVEVDVGPTPIGRFDPGDYAEAAREVFLFAVQAADPNTDGAVLWTRFAPGETLADATLALRVFEDGAGEEAGDLYVDEVATIGDGGFVHVEVAGLAPDTRYRYCFVIVPAAGGATARSPIGRFRTALDPEALRVVTFGGTSCVNAAHKPFRTLNRAAEANLDFFVLAGDTTYCDDAVTVAQYRGKWRDSFDSDGYRALLANVGTYATWDDHEIEDDWNPEVFDPGQLAAAKQVYLEHIACRVRPGVDPIADWRLWRSFRWGRTLELFVLDCRSERKPSTRHTSAAQYISREQMDWLKLGLRRSPCVFKLIVNSVPITDMPEGYPAEKDRWQGYEPQRDEILAHIGGPPLMPGVLWLSGDFHFGAVAKVDAPGARFADQWEIFMGQGANAANPVWEAIRDGSAAQFPFVTGTNNYVRFVCDPFATPPRITAEFIDGDGVVLHTQQFDFPTS